MKLLKLGNYKDSLLGSEKFTSSLLAVRFLRQRLETVIQLSNVFLCSRFKYDKVEFGETSKQYNR